MLRVENLSKSYGDGLGKERIVLDCLSLSVEAGESLSIRGPSGSGKSTLLNLIGGLDTPSSGRIIFNGADICAMDNGGLALYRLNAIAFIFQDQMLLPQCTVLENVLLPSIPQRANSRKEDPVRRAEKLLDEVKIADKKDLMPSLLSGGERQRAAIARALMNSPKMILADEPTASLDRENAVSAMKLLIAMKEIHGAAIVLVTHSEELAEKTEKQYLLQEGKLRLI